MTEVVIAGAGPAGLLLACELTCSGRPDHPGRRRRAHPPAGRDLPHLSGAKVKVEMGQKKGKIVVEFATIDDLERIVKAMSPNPGTP